MSNVISASSILLEKLKEDILSGKEPVRWRMGDDTWDPIEMGPGLFMVLGGAPGSGKTSLVTQLAVEALRSNPHLKVLIANCEMSPEVLLERQVARLAEVSAKNIRDRWCTDVEQVHQALRDLDSLGNRLFFHTGRYNLKDVANSVDDCEADIVIVDYLQRFTADGKDVMEQRMELDRMVQLLRNFAKAGKGIVAISSLARQSAGGSSGYAKLNMSSFRGSAELEFGADSCWILAPNESDEAPQLDIMLPAGHGSVAMELKCHKNRFGETPRLELRFNKVFQKFEVEDVESRLQELMITSVAQRSNGNGADVSPGSNGVDSQRMVNEDSLF